MKKKQWFIPSPHFGQNMVICPKIIKEYKIGKDLHFTTIDILFLLNTWELKFKESVENDDLELCWPYCKILWRQKLDIVKRNIWYFKTWVTSYVLLVASWKLKSNSWNSKVRVQIHEVRVQIREFKFTNYEFNFTSY